MITDAARAARDACSELEAIARALRDNPLVLLGRVVSLVRAAPGDFLSWRRSVLEHVAKAESLLTTARLAEQRARLVRVADAVRSVDPNEEFPVRVSFQTFSQAQSAANDARQGWVARNEPRLSEAAAVVEVLCREVRELWYRMQQEAEQRPAASSPARDPTLRSAIGTPNPDLVLHEKIGAGSFADVWRGNDGLREVAVKLCRPADGPVVPAIEHAKLLAKVDHPCISKVFHVTRVVDPTSGQVVECVVMELVRGQTLGEFLVQTVGSLECGLAGSICTDLLAAVEHLHSQRMSHGDLHADNIMVMNGRAKLIDPLYRGTLSASSARNEHRARVDMHDLCAVLQEVLSKADVPTPLLAALGQAAFVPNPSMTAVREAVHRSLAALSDGPGELATFASRLAGAVAASHAVNLGRGLAGHVEQLAGRSQVTGERGNA